MTTALLITAWSILEAVVVWRIAARINYRRGHAAGVSDAASLAYPAPKGGPS